MYTLIISKDKEEIREIKKVLDNMFEKIKCDYYDFQKGDPKALQSFNGEYMTQYSDWSYAMELNLQKYFYEE